MIDGVELVHEYLLIPDLIYPIIIGSDLLRVINAKIDLALGEIIFSHGGNWLSVKEVNFEHQVVSDESPSIKCIQGATVAQVQSDICQATFATDEEIDSTVNKCNLNFEQKQIFRDLLEKHRKIFSEIPGRTDKYTHHIKLNDSKEFCIKQYPVPVGHRDAVQKQLDNMENWGVIKRMATPYISPIVTTLKRDNSVRICLDARHLNQVMEKEYETPTPVEELMHSMSGVKYMSSLDLTHSYWQIPLADESQKYTGFKFNGKTYCFRVLPFGLTTSVSAFVRCLTAIFGNEFNAFLTQYVDDLLITSQSFEQHCNHLDAVFSRLTECGFTLKLKKCSFFRESMPFLGYILDSTGYHPDPNRTQAIADYQTPKNQKELQAFLGLINFDRSFSPNLAELVSPLTMLLRKKTKWKWTDLEEDSFKKVKESLSQHTLLYHPREDVPFALTTDSSDVGIGAELFQIIDGKHHTVAWASRQLLDRERRYSINEREALAVVWALNKFRIYLLGKHFTIFTDNSSVTYLKTCRLLSSRIARYALAIQEYDFNIQHIPGRKNIVADALSRYSAVRPPTPMDKMFRVLTILRLPQNFLSSLKNLPELQKSDPKLGDIRSEREFDIKIQKRFVIREDILYIRNENDSFYRLCVPQSMVQNFVQVFHETIGHFGSYKTWRVLKNEVWWNNMARDIKRILKHCEVCQKAKCSKMPKAELNPIIPSTKNVLVALDLYGPLPKSRGGTEYICVMLDVFSKYVTLYPLKKATSVAILNRIMSDYCPKMGKVDAILTDHGSQFTSKKWKETLEYLGIKHILSSIRHPQANPSERVMREVGRLIRTYCHEQQSKWASEVKSFMLFFNSLVHESTGFSPQELQFGKESLKLLPDEYGQANACRSMTVDEKLILAKESLENKAARRIIRHKMTINPHKGFEVGDLVLLRANPASSLLKGETKKFLLLFEGPYKIKKKIGTCSYLLVNAQGNKERGVFHISHLKEYYPPLK